MNLIKLREEILESNDVTVIAPKNIIAEIVLLLTIGGNVSVSTTYDSNDDNVLSLSKLHIYNPKVVVETAIFKDGKLNYTEGEKLIIEKFTMDTMNRLGVLEQLKSGFKKVCILE